MCGFFCLAMKVPNKNLRDLGVKWLPNIPSADASSIEVRAYRLYLKSLPEYGLDDIRFMIGQEIGAEYLTPIAINNLKTNILLEAEYYEGDLLNIIFKLHESFWEQHSYIASAFIKLLHDNYQTLNSLDLSVDIYRQIHKASHIFIIKYSVL
jgi:hypothetical protein